MVKHAISNSSSATLDDYRNGRHRRWEVELHRFDARFTAVGMDVDWAARRAFIDGWLQTHTYDDANAIVGCDVCQETIAQALLENRDPFVIPPAVKEVLHSFGNRALQRKHTDEALVRSVSKRARATCGLE